MIQVIHEEVKSNVIIYKLIFALDNRITQKLNIASLGRKFTTK